MLDAAWTALIGSMVGLVGGHFLTLRQAERSARLSARLAADAETLRHERAAEAEAKRHEQELLQLRLEAQHAALGDFNAYVTKHVQSGRDWNGECSMEATELMSRISQAFEAPEFADGLFLLLREVASWNQEENIPNFTRGDVASWVLDTKTELRRCIAATRDQANLPETKILPVLPPAPTSAGERLRQIFEQISATATGTEKKEQ